VLQSELRRLRARLAAQIGDEDLMDFILNRSGVDSNYIQDLKTRLE
jgi:E3 ubiquitin-protein ligase BRE1